MFIPSGRRPLAPSAFATENPSAIWAAGLPEINISSLACAPPHRPTSCGSPLIFNSPLVMAVLGGRPASFLSHASISLDA
jgi:hypothetical protein